MSLDTETNLKLQLTIKDGPVSVKSDEGQGVDRTYRLESGIEVSEFFPKNVDSGYYVITIKKNVSKLEEIEPAERELILVFENFAQVWLLSGGGLLKPFDLKMLSSANYSSNAQELIAICSRREGLQRMSSQVSLVISASGVYHTMPLGLAIKLRTLLHRDRAFEMMSHYHYLTFADSKNWFTHAYKILDILGHVYSKKRWKRIYSIPSEEVSNFETVLNNYDHRHAPNPNCSQHSATTDDMDTVKHLASRWIARYLDKEHKIGFSFFS